MIAKQILKRYLSGDKKSHKLRLQDKLYFVGK
jgi:hypothetical protein